MLNIYLINSMTDIVIIHFTENNLLIYVLLIFLFDAHYIIVLCVKQLCYCNLQHLDPIIV